METLVVYLVVLWGDRWRWWRDLGLALRVAVVSGSMGWLVSSISCSSCSCHGNRCRPGDSNSGCSGSIGCSYSVCRYRCLMNCVAGHGGGMRVCYPGSWLLTENTKKKQKRLPSQSGLIPVVTACVWEQERTQAPCDCCVFVISMFMTAACQSSSTTAKKLSIDSWLKLG